MRKLSLDRLLDKIGSSLALIGDKLTCNVALKASVFRMFLALGLVTATVEKPDLQRHVVVNGKRNLMARSFDKGYIVLVWIQNEAKSTS